MLRPEIIRHPVLPPSSIEHRQIKKDSHLFILPNGERFVIERSKGFRELGEVPQSLSTALGQVVLKRYSSGYRDNEERISENELVIRAQDVLWNQFGLSRPDAEIWANMVVRENPVVDRIFPHWLFISILANCQDKRIVYDILNPPQFVADQPSLDQLSQAGIGEEDLQKFREKTPPILAGTALPILGNFGSNRPSWRQKEIYTLLRKREDDVATGKFSFPGGRSDGLLELSALEELREELAILKLDNGEVWPQTVFQAIRRMDFLLVADQTLIDKQGQLRRFLNYVFVIWLAFPYSGGGRGWVNIQESIDAIKAYSGDGLAQWQPAMIDRGGKILNDEFERNLSPIAKLSVHALEKLLYNC